MERTGLEYETAEYDRMVVRDVNNYASRFTNGYIKYKGAFEIDKELHKDPSMRIVPIALSKYFFEDIPIEDTIKNHKDIFDFCLRLKTNKKSIPYWYYICSDGSLKRKKLQRTTRYFISNSGGSLKKHFISGSESGVNIGFNTTLFNKYYNKDNFKDYDINYDFYIAEANKIKNIVEYSKVNPTLFGW